MTDSAAKRASIPAWQRAQPVLGAEESTSPSAPEPKAPPSQPGAEESTKAPDDVPLLEQASKFLQDPSVRDAPRERRVAFLQAKGVPKEDIDKLLGAESTSESATPQKTATVHTKPTPTTPPPAQPQQQLSHPPRDVPPIITYPEFLVVPQKPPPLITTIRLLNTLTLASGVAASLYGLSRYVLHPMFDSLTAARHELYTHTFSKLDDLNAKLASIASTDPTTSTTSKHPRHPLDHQDHGTDNASEVSSTASDPSELYHRDAGTQTSPSISRRGSSTPSSPSLTPSAEASPDAVTGHANRLAIMMSHLSELLASAERNTGTADSLHSELDDLRGYLTELSYAGAGYWGGGGVYGGGYGSGTAGTTGKGKKEDGIEAVKAEIRGVKGVLLAARNFPGGGRGR